MRKTAMALGAVALLAACGVSDNEEGPVTGDAASEAEYGTDIDIVPDPAAEEGDLDAMEDAAAPEPHDDPGSSSGG